MRIVALLIAGLFTTCVAPAMAEEYTKEELQPWVKCIASYRPDKPRPDCSRLYPTRELPKSTSTYRDSPEYRDYEFQTWKANEDYNRELEAINRDYELRRAGVLP
ncbi:hypothetical protein [Sphingobium sp. LMA1-1-1.1]|jgi:hypothetical protein|uniref:hypothetical protein n=1 Tax=Sphingobium sp. LMA1-1-1.1 TaxID=3135238 RepID=UPI0034333ECE